MNTKNFYNEKYFGLKQPFGNMLDFGRIEKYLKSPMLDVGCGQGTDVNKLNKLGYTVGGCDIFSNVCKLGKEFFFHSFEEKPTEKKYSTIISIHVIEHVFDYISFLKNIRKSLADSGHFILTLPNAYSFTYRLQYFLGNEKLTMGMGDPNSLEKNTLEPHIRFFGKQTICKVLEKNGFEVIEAYTTDSKKRRVPFAGNIEVISMGDW